MSKKRIISTLILIALLWASSQALVSAYQGSAVDGGAPIAGISKSVSAPEADQSAPTAAGAEEGGASWFLVNDGSQWSDQEQIRVQQIMDRTWRALDSLGVDGQSLLAGYHFRRLDSEFVPGEERLLAIVDHQAKEIILADGAFERLHGFYIYHELGHAVDRQLDRMPSEAYHRLANAGQARNDGAGDASTWQTTDGFWLRYHGRDDREEATADAFAWWVMAQAEQPKPFFAGTPVTTDYDEIAGAMAEAMGEASNASR